MKKFMLFFVLFMLFAGLAQSQTLTFTWDSHPEAAQITGFKLYQSKTSGTYGSVPIAVFVGGNLTTGTITQTTLGRYYFVLTAYKEESPTEVLESDFSNEVTAVLKPKPPKSLNITVPVMVGEYEYGKDLAFAIKW